MVLKKLYLIPVIYGILAIGSTMTKYVFITLLKQYPNALSWISVRDSSLVGECIFTHLAQYSSYLLILCVYFRHRQTVQYYAHRLEWESLGWRRVSLSLAVIGALSAIFMGVIAHCQDEKLNLIHDIADTILFATGLLYAWGQTIFTWILIPRMCSRSVCALRLLIVIVETAAFAFYKYIQNNTIHNNDLYMEVSLWTISVCFHIYIITFYIELQYSYMHSPKVIIIKDENNDEQRLINNNQ